MKKITLIVMCLLFTGLCQAQAFQEWFNQKQTQIKYLFEQIAAFQMYGGYVEKGYDIASNGLGIIRDLKKGDFNLHSEHFSSLRQVSPAIKKWGRVADIIAMQAYILKVSGTAIRTARNSQLLTGDEMGYLEKVHENLLDQTSTDTGQLLQLVTDQKLEMTDDERITRIHALYNTIRDKYMFLRSFSGGVSVLMLQRTKEQEEINASRKIHGIN